jgi:hypothetical protein
VPLHLNVQTVGVERMLHNVQLTVNVHQDIWCVLIKAASETVLLEMILNAYNKYVKLLKVVLN